MSDKISFCPHCLEDHPYDDENCCVNCGVQIPDGVINLENAYIEVAAERDALKQELDNFRIHGASMISIQESDAKEKKRRLGDELILNKFVPHKCKLGTLVKDYMRVDFTNELQVKVRIIGGDGSWKGEFEADYTNISTEQLFNIAAFMNDVLSDKE